jgi:hypothetical protein
MNQQVKIPVVDQIQAAEKQYYVALQRYDRAIRTPAPPDILAHLKTEVCEAFAALKAAHDKLELDCSD